MSDDSEKANWWKTGAKPKPGNRHRKRREYRELRDIHCRSLVVHNSYGDGVIVLETVNGKQPYVTLCDRDGTPKLWLTLERVTEQSAHDGKYAVEKPVIVLRERGRKIRLSFDDGDALITVSDANGTGELDSVATPLTAKMTIDNSQTLHKKGSQQ